MRKIIKRKINISTHKRDLIDFINDEFYSHDKHNAFIEFTMKSLPTDNIIALFYFQKTKRYVETKAFVDGDKFTIEFDTSLINTDETVLGFIYFEKVAQSADVHRFSFGVKVSEIDKLHDMPIQEQTTKRVVAIEDIVTKAELDELFKRIEKNGGTYNDTEIRNSISSIETRVQTLEAKPDKDTVYDDSDVKNRLSTLETNASRYLTEHQSLSDYALKSELYNDSALSERVTRLEQKPAVDTSNLATREELAEVRNAQPQIDKTNLVTKEELEAKGYLTAHQTLDEYAKKSEIPERYNDASLVERVNSLESKAIANGSYDDKPLLDKIHTIEEQFRNASNLYLTSHQSLEHLVTKQELEEKGYLTQHQDLSGLVTRDELASKNYLTEHQSLASLVTRDELEQKHYLTEHQSLENYALKSEIPQAYNDADLKERVTSLEAKALSNGAYDDSNLRTRIQALETKEDKDTIYDDADVKRRLSALETNHVTKEELHEATELDYSQIVTNDELEAKHYLTAHQSLEHLVTKQELDSKGYLTSHQSLEDYAKKSELPAPYNDSVLISRIDALESRPVVNSSNVVTKDELDKKGYLTEASLTAINRTLGEQNTKISTLQAKAEYEIHGSGMPNGKVEAPIGTTYVDTAVTNGALKWIKHSGTGNTGWKVLIGDTGWRTLNSVSKLVTNGKTSFIKIRRVNNLVTYNFGGLQWGWFGVGRRNGPGFVKHNSTGDRGAKVLQPGTIPEGFRSENSLIGGIYNDAGKPYGIWYLGGKSDSNYIQFSFNDPIPTDRDIGDIRVSAISYVTDEDWPTTLPQN